MGDLVGTFQESDLNFTDPAIEFVGRELKVYNFSNTLDYTAHKFSDDFKLLGNSCTVLCT
jgi:hypothetical protein